MKPRIIDYKMVSSGNPKMIAVQRKNQMSKQHVDIECPECGGTGLYHGLMERDGEYVICVRCGGTGKQTLSYTPFTRRKDRRGVKKVRAGSGMILDNPALAHWVSYDEFKQKIPA